MSQEHVNILEGCRLNKENRSYFGHIDGTITDKDGLPANPTPNDMLIHREKPAYKHRKQQIAINLLGLEGGRPYVNNRLSRHAGESEIDWIGGERSDGSCATGRLQQTHAFPYLGRMASKVNQYVFSEDPKREGIDEELENNITRDGTSINDFMREVSDNLFAAEGCWIGIDAPAPKQDGTEYSELQKEQSNLRPYWNLYTNLDVPDWKYDEVGELLWLKTRGIEYDDTNPAAKPKIYKVVKLWERGRVTVIRIESKKDGRYRNGSKDKIDIEKIPLTNSNGQVLTKVPFIQCGKLSGKPIPFDDLESINRTIMDLQSVDRANLYKGVYPQLMMPAGCMNAVMDAYGISATEATKLLLGFNYPIQVPDDATVTPAYLTPSASDLGIIGERVQDLKRDLFEVVGLALEKDSRQVASAEAKAWDFIDISAVMKSRAEELQGIETKCAQLMNEWDPSISIWEPVYNTNFDIGNFKEEMEALVMMGNISGPPEYNQHILDKVIERAERLLSKTDPEKLKALQDAVDKFDGTAVNVEFADETLLPDP